MQKVLNKFKVDSAAVSGYNIFEVIYLSGMTFQFAGCMVRRLNGGKNFNHYSPANYLAKNISAITLSDETKDNFEKLFREVNKLF